MKILVADDHPLFRAGIRHVLLQLGAVLGDNAGDSVEIVEADDHAAVVALLEKHNDFALLLLDLAMPGMQGLTALSVLTQRYPALPIVILSASEARTDMQGSLDSGALGFIPKSSSPAVMLQALRLVMAGGVYVPSALVQGTAAAKIAATTPGTNQRDELTPRQTAVLARVIEGKSNKVIATEMGLSEATVKAHVTAVFKTLRVTNRMQAAIAAGRFTTLNS